MTPQEKKELLKKLQEITKKSEKHMANMEQGLKELKEEMAGIGKSIRKIIEKQ